MANKENLESVYLSIRNGLMRAVSRLVPPKEIEDIVQETYVRICAVKTEQILHPRSFLYRTARNLALDHLKRVPRYRARRPPHVQDSDRNEARRALAEFFLVIGRSRDALRITSRAIIAIISSTFCVAFGASVGGCTPSAPMSSR